MTKEEILEQQVEALEKLLQLRKAVIDELEDKVRKLEGAQYPGWIGAPIVQPFIGGGILGGLGGGGQITITNTCPDGTPHQYPNVWNGIGSPHCSKCGAAQYGSAGGVTVQTTGYVAPADDSNNLGTVLTLQNAAKK
jgi:hypothetical protein